MPASQVQEVGEVRGIGSSTSFATRTRLLGRGTVSVTALHIIDSHKLPYMQSRRFRNNGVKSRRTTQIVSVEDMPYAASRSYSLQPCLIHAGQCEHLSYTLCLTHSASSGVHDLQRFWMRGEGRRKYGTPAHGG